MASLDIPFNTPGLAPPDGVIPNFDNPYSRAFQTRAVLGVSLSIMILFYIMRVLSKLFVSKKWGMDDYACTFGVISSTVYSAVVLLVLGHPLGPHQWNVRAADFNGTFLKRSLTGTVLYSIAACGVKVSLLVLYFRLFQPNHLTRNLIKGGVLFAILFYLSCVIANCVACIPHSGDGGWTSTKTNQRCASMASTLSVVQGAISVALDFYVLCIPLQMVWKLHLPLPRKVGVSAIFLTGILVCVLSIMNIAYRIPFDASHDISWNAIPVYTISVAEVNIGIAVSCMPVLAPLFHGKTFSSMQLPSFRYFRSLGSKPNTKDSTGAGQLPSSQEDLTHTGPKFVRGGKYVELQDVKNNSNGDIRSASINSEV